MLVLETLHGLRVIAAPASLDGVRWSEGTIVLRFAPDEAFALGATEVQIPDEYAIVVHESAFVGSWLTREELADSVLPHIEWPLPERRPSLAQGFVAGVPAKLWLDGDRALLLCAAAYVHELADRLG
ncbi:MAG: hypothetical protein H0W07_10455 [Chloroflexi bacterium]|nr:hypothetical protein [Chloroflexota bacterium]